MRVLNGTEEMREGLVASPQTGDTEQVPPGETRIRAPRQPYQNKWNCNRPHFFFFFFFFFFFHFHRYAGLLNVEVLTIIKS